MLPRHDVAGSIPASRSTPRPAASLSPRGETRVPRGSRAHGLVAEWQTRQFQELVSRKGREGSSPSGLTGMRRWPGLQEPGGP